MGVGTKIEWTRGDHGEPGATWNPVTGCTKVSAGCDNCYAQTFAERWRGTPGHPFEQGFDLRLWPDRLVLPLQWRRPRRVFVNSMSDLFHARVPDTFIAEVFAVMAMARQHTFQVLTKRPGRMASLLLAPRFAEEVIAAVRRRPERSGHNLGFEIEFPLHNVWLGTSVESQSWVDVRLRQLARTPAALRFVSCEPLLGPIDLTPWLRRGAAQWVIAGGESGPRARPMHPQWARSLRDQCAGADVAFFFKQWGAHVPEEQGQRRGAVSFVLPSGEPDNQQPVGADTATMRRVGKARAGNLLDGQYWLGFPTSAR